MLPEDLKADVLEIAAIAKACPENLQGRCFELLLSRYLEGLPSPKSNGKTPLPPRRPHQQRIPSHQETLHQPKAVRPQTKTWCSLTCM